MNPLDLLIAATAADAGRAQRREQRHIHLESRPIAIATMQMSIESHAIWGALVGTDPDSPRLMARPSRARRRSRSGRWRSWRA